MWCTLAKYRIKENKEKEKGKRKRKKRKSPLEKQTFNVI
jgi:hypothetical protein|tara:strand:+ start:4225 stop:4341 length:117 start_codon:yes stop_codon:yes gene_type:complete